MRIGILGLGKMGSQIAIKLLDSGHELVTHSSNPATTELMRSKGADPASSLEDFVSKLGAQPVVWLMIPADAVDAQLDQLLPLLKPGTLIVDGGNSDWRRTRERAARAQQAQVRLMDVGTSGGIHGLANGFSMMVGGELSDFTTIEPVLDVLAQPSGAYEHLGPTACGHYVKMIHNGIEYGMMQAFAEGYELLQTGPIQPLKLDRIASVWQHGSIVSSSLNGLIAGVLTENPQLEGIDGFVAESGEGQWTYETAQAANVPTPALVAALTVRRASQQGQVSYATKLLAAMRHAFGGHSTLPPTPQGSNQ